MNNFDKILLYKYIEYLENCFSEHFKNCPIVKNRLRNNKLIKYI